MWILRLFHTIPGSSCAGTKTISDIALEAGARHTFITEMAVFTLETDYPCETGNLFDSSCQIGNKS